MEPKMTRPSYLLLHLTIAVCTVLWNPLLVIAQIQRSPSPASEFVTQPSNVTVPQGERVVLKCVLASYAHVCRWYFLEEGLDFFNERVSPVLVKDFSPAHHRDCSIRINKVRKIQEGQWLCQALKFHSSKFLMTSPAFLRVITKSESVTWKPPADDLHSTPRQGRRENDSHEGPKSGSHGDETSRNSVEFESNDEDYIQNTPVRESTILKCQINKPISTCSWIMPDGAVFNVSQEHSNESFKYSEDYKLEGDLSEGSCALRVHEVQHKDEGNWRCVVQVNDEQEFHGPLLHLHIIDHENPSSHSHEGIPLVAPEDESVNLLVIGLVLVSGILFITVIMLFTCLYRRMSANSEETRKILQISPHSSMDIPHKTLPSTDFTTTSVMTVEPRKKLPLQYVDLDHYNQYLDMSVSGSANDGYIMMPNSSIRSSTSSRTTLSTVSTLPVGRSRSASNSTTISGGSPHLTTLVDNPSYNPDDALDRKGIHLSRPDSLYSTDHVYEEIKEKKDDFGKMEKIEEATTPETPTYTNILEDCEGYMIPKKSPSSDALPTLQLKETPKTFPKLPLPNPPQSNKDDTTLIQSQVPSAGQGSHYSRIGQNGLLPASSICLSSENLGPGYSRLGTPTDPMERYDTPRPPANDPMERYDVPRNIPTESSLQPDIPVSTEVCVDGLTGTIV